MASGEPLFRAGQWDEPASITGSSCDASRDRHERTHTMPGSDTRRKGMSWPQTPTEQTVPDAFENTGECVIERIVEVVRDLPPPSPSKEMKTYGSLSPGALFRGHQNGAEMMMVNGTTQHANKQYPVEVEIKVRGRADRQMSLFPV